MSADTDTKVLTTPNVDFGRARESVTSRLADAQDERASVEASLAEAMAGDESDPMVKADVADLSKRLVDLDIKIRGLMSAGPALDRQEQAVKAAAEAARLAGVEVKLAKAVTALDKATAALADNLQTFTAALETARRAEGKVAELGGQVGQALRNPSTVQRVRFAMFKAGYNPPEFTSLDLPSSWTKIDEIAAMREPRCLRKTVPSPATLGSGPRKVDAESLVAATE